MSKFDDTVAKVVKRLREGRVLLSERVRSGKKRSISVGPYRTAVPQRQYALFILPAMPDQDDVVHTNPDRVAREFVRLVGVDEAGNALVREFRKREG